MAFLHVLADRPDARQKLEGFGNRSNYHIDKALAFIQANYSNRLKVSDIANYPGISRNYLFSLFQEHMGQSPQEYLSHFRLSHGRELLAGTEYSVDGISYACGYEDPAVFSRAFKKKYHMTPSQYRAYILARQRQKPSDRQQNTCPPGPQ